MCLQLLGASPLTPTGVLPLDPAGGLPSPDPLFCPPLSKFLATPLLIRLLLPSDCLHGSLGWTGLITLISLFLVFRLIIFCLF